MLAVLEGTWGGTDMVEEDEIKNESEPCWRIKGRLSAYTASFL